MSNLHTGVSIGIFHCLGSTLRVGGLKNCWPSPFERIKKKTFFIKKFLMNHVENINGFLRVTELLTYQYLSIPR